MNEKWSRERASAQLRANKSLKVLEGIFNDYWAKKVIRDLPFLVLAWWQEIESWEGLVQGVQLFIRKWNDTFISETDL